MELKVKKRSSNTSESQQTCSDNSFECGNDIGILDLSTSDVEKEIPLSMKCVMILITILVMQPNCVVPIRKMNIWPEGSVKIPYVIHTV